MRAMLLAVSFCLAASAQEYLSCGAPCSNPQQTCIPPDVGAIASCDALCEVKPTSAECGACYADTLQADENYGTCMGQNASCVESQQIYEACTGYNDGLTGCWVYYYELLADDEVGWADIMMTWCLANLQSSYDGQIDDANNAFTATSNANAQKVASLNQAAGTTEDACFQAANAQ